MVSTNHSIVRDQIYGYNHVNQRWIYFAGRKMFSKTGSTLKAITPNRLASEAKHYPYGETQGTPPADTKDYFATYRRDDTGLDYAMNRYYSATMGRFKKADPDGGRITIVAIGELAYPSVIGGVIGITIWNRLAEIAKIKTEAKEIAGSLCDFIDFSGQ